MLVFDKREIGDRLLARRKQLGLTQAQVSEAAELSDRTYADIERGAVNMRVETALRICSVLRVTPDEILTRKENELTAREDELLERLDACAPKDRETALRLLEVFLQSLD